MGPYINCILQRLKRWIQVNNRLHCSLEFAFDPGNLVCNPPKIIPHVVDRGSNVIGIRDELESDLEYARRGGGFDG